MFTAEITSFIACRFLGYGLCLAVSLQAQFMNNQCFFFLLNIEMADKLSDIGF